MNRLKWFVAIAAVAMTAGTATFAQDQVDLKKMATRMRQNQEELRQYSWETKMIFLVNNEQRRVDIFTVRYVMGGMVEKMQINSEVAKGNVRRPDGKKLKKKELEAAREFVIEVKDQLDGYLNPLFAEKAVATSKILKGEGTLLLLSRDVVATGDSVEIAITESTQQPISAKIRTAIDGSPVALDIEFGTIEYGPNYTSRSITTSVWQGFELAIITENSNYVDQGS